MAPTEKSGPRNPVSRLFRILVEARWFFTFSASVCATIVGISLTFGINSCRERQRSQREMRKSMLQAVDNLGERFEDARRWVDIIDNETALYSMADSRFREGKEVDDSIVHELYNNLPFIRLAAYDHEFEKVFRQSYQMWELLNSNDSLMFYISQCYDGLNMVENTCEELSDGLIATLGTINAGKDFFRKDEREWVMTLLEDPQFQYYMSIRRVKAEVASKILNEAEEDYRRHVIPLSEQLRK